MPGVGLAPWISTRSVWKRGFRSVAHCYSGCGIGEVIGITAATVILSFPILWVVVTTFALAYLFGYALTVGPLVQEGVGWGEAVLDGLVGRRHVVCVVVRRVVGRAAVLDDREDPSVHPVGVRDPHRAQDGRRDVVEVRVVDRDGLVDAVAGRDEDPVALVVPRLGRRREVSLQ